MPPWIRPRWADEPTMLTLGTVVEALTGQAYPFLDQVVTDGAIDSRLAIPGSLFVALPGEAQPARDRHHRQRRKVELEGTGGRGPRGPLPHAEKPGEPEQRDRP